MTTPGSGGKGKRSRGSAQKKAKTSDDEAAPTTPTQKAAEPHAADPVTDGADADMEDDPLASSAGSVASSSSSAFVTPVKSTPKKGEKEREREKEVESDGLRNRKRLDFGPSPAAVEKSKTDSLLSPSSATSSPSVRKRAVSWADNTAHIIPPYVEMDSSTLSWAALTLLTVASFAIRFHNIAEPHYVVFDEVHFGKFASYYIRGTYFFDVHPPLAKLLLALTAYVSGNDGSFLYENIGMDYQEHEVNYLPLRHVVAFFGALLTPLAYLTVRWMGYSVPVAFTAGAFVLFDNAMVTQCRFILLDAFLLFFTMATVASLVKFVNSAGSPFTPAWWLWLSLTGFFMGMAVSVKYVGLFVVAIVGVHTVVELWSIFGNHAVSVRKFGSHFSARALCLILLPAVVYCSTFAFHLWALPRTGPGDSFMSMPFLAGIEGTDADKLVRNQPQFVTYGMWITIKSHDAKCWLHSHKDKYPLRYDDGRVSSQQSQVTCYQFKDANNWWAVVAPSGNLTHPGREGIVYSGDSVKLVHVARACTLNSHNVAAPLDPTQQEVSCHGGAESLPAEDVWRVDVSDSYGLPFVSKPWRTLGATFTLTHTTTLATLRSTGKTLPDWGFRQLEVVSTKNLEWGLGAWRVEEAKDDREPPMNNTRPVDAMSFTDKLVELHTAMFDANSRLTSEHAYASRPYSWPLLRRGLSFYQKDDMQIYLLGNPVVWHICTGMLAVYAILDVFFVLRRKRGIKDMTDALYARFTRGRILFFGWLLHYAPFFPMQRQLFLHHYLPAQLFAAMLAPIALHEALALARVDGQKTSWVMAALLAVSAGAAFVVFAPLTYATPLTHDEAQALKWKATWDIMIPRKIE